MSENSVWDCIVVGGGAAGLSGALVLGRARKKTLVVDAGRQSNLAAHGVGGLLGHDGRPPHELYAAGRKELTAYPAVELREGEVVGGEIADGLFRLEMADGSAEVAKRVLLATGMDYHYADVPGIEALWGRSVFHCPFCHGWEVRDLTLGVLDAGPMAVHRALLLRAWSDDVTLLTGGPAELESADRESLKAAGVAVDERPLARLIAEGHDLTAVEFASGAVEPYRGLLVGVTMHQRSALATQLGAKFAPANPQTADAIEVDQMLQTTVPGMFAAGDVVPGMPSVANSISSGSRAAAAIVGSLVTEGFGAGRSRA
jgi:thioredoxin reductase